MKTIEQLFDTEKSVLQELESDFLKLHAVKLFVKRDDLIDEVVSGNKWRKLKYNVVKCLHDKKQGILTFGGAYSNHLIATSSACKRAGLKSVGIVRGDELSPNSNSTLEKCVENGMDLVFVSRNEYSLRNERSYLEELITAYPMYHIVPEGGANYYGMIGCQELINEIDLDFDHVYVAQGTSTTSCGMLLGLTEDQALHVVPVLKNYNLLSEMRRLMEKSSIGVEMIDYLMQQVVVHSDHHFGGYAKYSDELLSFISDFYREYNLKLDPVYTGKAMFALFESIKKGELTDSTVVFVHTGGLQGVEGIEKRSGRPLFS